MVIVIIGGGYLGQLLHTLIPQARVLDWRPTAPAEPARSFGPQYLWWPIRGLPCEEFNVITHVDGKPASPESIRDYKVKVGKEQDHSDWRTQFRTMMKGYEVQLPKPNIEYNQMATEINRMLRTLNLRSGEVIRYDWLISTIPLPALMDLCKMTKPEFESRPIYVTVRPVNPLSYLYVNYCSDPNDPIYRRTNRNGMMHSESLHPLDSGSRVHRLVPGKIYKNRDVSSIRAELMVAKILTVGRYGAWDPEQLAHETYREVEQWKQVVLG